MYLVYQPVLCHCPIQGAPETPNAGDPESAPMLALGRPAFSSEWANCAARVDLPTLG